MTQASRSPLRTSALVLACVLGLGAMQAACSQSDASGSSCEDGRVDSFKELIVVEESVLTDARARNDRDGVWSFRHAMENMAPSGVDASEFVNVWLSSWSTETELNGYPLDEAAETGLRSRQMKARIICPWLKRTPANGCDASCSACTSKKLDLAQAPFRLIAIANRIDLHEQVMSEPSGEGRLVFALTEGPADDEASKPLAMTVNVEYALPPTRTIKEWASAWHDLGRFDTFDEPYRAALENVTNAFTKRGSNPGAQNGSAIGQVRTNENALDWIWQLREFGLGTDGQLHLRPVRNTPPAQLNNSPVLRDYLNSHKDEILRNQYELPVSLSGGSADTFRYSWQASGVDEQTRRAFEGGTCNGCHGSAKPNVDTAFHVSPFRKGVEKLSPFAYDPQGGPDEIKTRTASMMRVVCSQ